jgi:hypothetical protein
MTPMTQAAILRLAYLALKQRLTEHEICRMLRESRATQGQGDAITAPTIERTVRIAVAARAHTAA